MRIELRRICLDRAKYVADIDSFRRINAISFKLCGMLVDNVKLVLRHFGANCAIIAALGYNFKTTCTIVSKGGDRRMPISQTQSLCFSIVISF